MMIHTSCLGENGKIRGFRLQKALKTVDLIMLRKRRSKIFYHTIIPSCHKIHHYHHHHLGLLMLSWCWDLNQVWLLTAVLWGIVMVMIVKILLMMNVFMLLLMHYSHLRRWGCWYWWWQCGRIWRWWMMRMVHYSHLSLVSRPPWRSQTSARSLCLIWGGNVLIVIIKFSPRHSQQWILLNVPIKKCFQYCFLRYF